jgi:hypothetical protein
LAAAFALHDKSLIDNLLYKQTQFGFSDVLKAVTVLDSGREKRAIEAKIKRLTRDRLLEENKKDESQKEEKMNQPLQSIQNAWAD